MRRLIATVLVVLNVAGCSKSVEIPLDKIGEPEWRERATYRIRVDEGESYVKRFSVVDSLLIIDERQERDEALFGAGLVPADSIPLAELLGVEKIESRTKVLGLYVAVIGMFAGLLLWLAPSADS